MEDFNHLTFENIALSNCSGGVDNSTLYLIAGSEVNFNHVRISSRFEYDGAQIIAVDVVGLFSVSYGNDISLMDYSVWHCNRPSSFEFSNNNRTGLNLEVNCSDVHITITDSLFDSVNVLHVNFNVVTRNTVLVNNSQFRGDIVIECNFNVQCDNNIMKFTGVIAGGGPLVYYSNPTSNCTVHFEDSMFSPDGFVKLYHIPPGQGMIHPYKLYFKGLLLPTLDDSQPHKYTRQLLCS